MRLARGVVLAFLLALLVPGPAFASPPGALISNQASLDFLNLAGVPETALSNEVSVVVAVVRSPATVEFTRVSAGAGGTWQEPVGPSACFDGAAYTPLPDPTLVGGNTIDPSQPWDASSTSTYNIGETAFIRLEDADQNVDYQVIDYAVVTVSSVATGDTETIQLSETGPDTGIFTGYVPLGSGPANAGDCILQGAQNTEITVDYIDPADGTDTAGDIADLDPVQRVFESRTGTLLSLIHISEPTRLQ